MQLAQQTKLPIARTPEKAKTTNEVDKVRVSIKRKLSANTEDKPTSQKVHALDKGVIYEKDSTLIRKAIKSTNIAKSTTKYANESANALSSATKVKPTESFTSQGFPSASNSSGNKEKSTKTPIVGVKRLLLTSRPIKSIEGGKNTPLVVQPIKIIRPTLQSKPAMVKTNDGGKNTALATQPIKIIRATLQSKPAMVKTIDGGKNTALATQPIKIIRATLQSKPATEKSMDGGKNTPLATQPINMIHQTLKSKPVAKSSIGIPTNSLSYLKSLAGYIQKIKHEHALASGENSTDCLAAEDFIRNSIETLKNGEIIESAADSRKTKALNEKQRVTQDACTQTDVSDIELLKKIKTLHKQIAEKSEETAALKAALKLLTPTDVVAKKIKEIN